jgi:hypothetical protein
MSESNKNTFEREIRFEPAYDKRDTGHGIHGAQMRWLLKGPLGIIQFLVFTQWHLPAVMEEMERKFEAGLYPYNSASLWKPLPADLGYHSPRPMYDGQSDMPCDLMPEGKCWYDGSGLNAAPVFALLVSEGSDAVWLRLEEEYRLRFEAS